MQRNKGGKSRAVHNHVREEEGRYGWGSDDGTGQRQFGYCGRECVNGVSSFSSVWRGVMAATWQQGLGARVGGALSRRVRVKVKSCS